ncbi:MAG: hypothetical protein VX464_06590 [Pseudomonadota bacterium]|nr:hypothetical protein [Pseudomonadota bacterium]
MRCGAVLGVFAIAASCGLPALGSDDIWGQGNAISNVQGGVPMSPPATISETPPAPVSREFQGTRADCDVHFSTARASESAEWQRLEAEVPNRAIRQAAWADWLAKRDATSTRCTKAHPGIYDVVAAQTHLRSATGETPAATTSRIKVPTECAFVMSDVIVHSAPSGDFSMTVKAIDGYTTKIGFNSGFQTPGNPPSQSIDAKLQWACSRYLDESKASRFLLRNTRDILERIVQFLHEHGLLAARRLDPTSPLGRRD